MPKQILVKFLKTSKQINYPLDNILKRWWSVRGVLGSPRHSPHLWFIPSAHLDFFAIFVIPSPHLDNHTFTSPRVQIIPSPHLDHHTFTSPRVQIMPSPHLELHTLNSPRGQIISYLLQLKSNSIVDVPLIFQTTIPNFLRFQSSVRLSEVWLG